MRRLALLLLVVTGAGCHRIESRSCDMQFTSGDTIFLGKHSGSGVEYIAVFPECSSKWEAQGYISDHDYQCLKTGVVTPGGNPQIGEVTLYKGPSSIDVPILCVDTWNKQGYK